MLIIDAHLDLSYNVIDGRDVARPAAEQPAVRNLIATVGLPDLRKGSVGLVCGTIFCQPKGAEHPGYETGDEAAAQAEKQWAWYERQFEDSELRLVYSAADLPTAAEPTISMVLLLEGADALQNRDDVQRWFRRGLRIVGLAWKGTRHAGGTSQPGPLTDEGRALVRQLDELGMIHDTSHLAEESFWEMLDRSGGPVMASHSNCRAIVASDPVQRHLTDDMIRAIIKRDGVIGINFFDRFLLPAETYGKRRATLADVIGHIRHVCDLAGDAGHIGLGTDMDGGLGREQIPVEITTSADLPRVAEALSDGGFSDEDVFGIMGLNWRRFFARSLPK